MTDLRMLQKELLANGKVEGHEVEQLRTLVSADGKIDRLEAELLLELFKRVDRVSPAFERFFYNAIKKHLLSDGMIGAEAAGWLRKLVFADGKISDREKKLIRELKGEASQVCAEFQALYDACIANSNATKL